METLPGELGPTSFSLLSEAFDCHQARRGSAVLQTRSVHPEVLRRDRARRTSWRSSGPLALVLLSKNELSVGNSLFEDASLRRGHVCAAAFGKGR